MRKLYQFQGGIHPPAHKTQSVQQPIARLPIPDKLVIPFHQHIGNAARPLVVAGDHVLKGQMIGIPEDGISSAVHASTSGTIETIEQEVVAHVSGLPDLCAVLRPDGRDQWCELKPFDYQHAEVTEVRQALRMAGVVGLGGAAFPSDLKLGQPHHQVETLILNGAECEPYISCDDMLMRERAADIVAGAEILVQLLQPGEVVVAIEDNKPEAIACMQQAVQQSALNNMEVVAIPTIYPAGSAKQLIRMITGKEVAVSAKTLEYGVQCFNVGTVYSIYRALVHGEPLVSRIATLAGNVRRPQNVEMLIGTPIEELLQHAEPLPDTNRYIMGGPMMGVSLPQPTVSAVKATNCVIAASDKLFPPPGPVMPCIRCSRCAEVCPAGLQPQDLYRFAKAKDFDHAQELHLMDCIECGACSYVCPSNIPLVQFYRYAKGEIWARDREQTASDIARQRFEFREYRLEREKQEKAARLAAKEKAAKAKKAAAAKAADAGSDQQKIQEAMARAREKSAQSKPKNTDNLTPAQQAEIDEIEARRQKIQQRASSNVEHKED